MMADIKREKGSYLVDIEYISEKGSEWSPAWFTGEFWQIIGSNNFFKESEFNNIGKKLEITEDGRIENN